MSSGETSTLKELTTIGGTRGEALAHIELVLPARGRRVMLFALACTIGVLSAWYMGHVSGSKMEVALMFGLAVWAGISTLWSP